MSAGAGPAREAALGQLPAASASDRARPGGDRPQAWLTRPTHATIRTQIRSTREEVIIEAHLCSNNRPDLHRRTHANAGTPRGTSRRTRTTPGFGWLSDGSGRWARPRNRVGARTDSANDASRARFRDAARLRAPQARQWSAVSGPAAGRRDCARNGPHEELPAQGIARARVVLSVRLARCQREAARAFYGVASPDPGRQPA